MGKRIEFLVIFSLAFAFTEAIVASYVKTIIGLANFNSLTRYPAVIDWGFVKYIDSIPTFVLSSFALLETRREAATMVMLLGVALLTGKTVKQRLGAFLISFALWDIFYYVFLKIITGWPQSLGDMDVFAITPGVWAGPVISAIAVSSSLLILGIWLFLSKTSLRSI